MKGEGGGIVALAIAPVIATKMNFIEQRDEEIENIARKRQKRIFNKKEIFF